MRFGVVTLVAFLFGPTAAPLGLAIGLSPVLTWLAVSVGCAVFVGVAVASLGRARQRVAGRVAGRVADRAWLGAPVALPVLGWLWRRAASRVVGPDAAASVDRVGQLVRRLGLSGAGLLGPALGRWAVPVAGVALGADRPRLVGWLAAGGMLWAGLAVGACQLLVVALG